MEVSGAYEAYLASVMILGVVAGLVTGVGLCRKGWRAVTDTPLIGDQVGVVLAVVGFSVGFLFFVGPPILIMLIFDQNWLLP